jgi:hypothetical protein
MWTSTGGWSSEWDHGAVSFEKKGSCVQFPSIFRSVTGVCFLLRFHRKFHQEIWTGNTVLFRRPRAKVDKLAAF